MNGLSEREDDEVVHNGFRQNSTSPADDVNSFSVSLENLVETFDQKITTVLKNLDENTTQMAPVQVRSQDEVMSESQFVFSVFIMLSIEYSKAFDCIFFFCLEYGGH